LGITVTEQAAWLELSRPDVSSAQVEQAESTANEIVWGNRAVRIASVDAAQAGKIGLAVPPGAIWPLQVVSVESTGVTACQGVHVARTGEMGLIKVLGCEARGERLRVQFACGARALAEFRQAEQTLALVAGNLGVAAANVAPVVTRLTSEWNAARAELETLRGQVVGFEAEALTASAEAVNGARVVRRVYPERDVAEVRQLARLVVAQPGLVALLGTAGSRAQLVFARSADVSHDMTVIVRAAAQMLNTQGGGQPALAESVPVRADEARVQAAIAKAAKLLPAQR
jgi:alanyl-tRNA synthetase